MRRFHYLSALVLAGLACCQQTLRAEPDVERASVRISVSDAQPEPAATGAPAHQADAPAHHADLSENCPTRFAVYGEYLLLAARNESVPYAQIRDGEGPLAVPRGATGNVETEYSSGIRLGAQANLNSGTVFNLGFSWYDTRNSDQIAVAPNDPLIIHALTTHPNTINAAADSLSADARLLIRFYTVDADFRCCLCSSDCGQLAALVGARYAHLDQDFDAHYTLLGETNVNTAINFDGGGPRLGLLGHYNIRDQLFLYGRTDVSLLFGHFGASYLQTNVFSGVQADTTFSDDRFVPIWEAELGLGWRSKNGRAEVTVGYTAAAWFNVMTTSSWIQGVQEAAFSSNRDNLRDTLTFDGLFARFLFRF